MAKLSRRPSNEELLSKAIDRLEIISKIVALTLIQGVSYRQDQIDLLSVAGFSIREIADLLGISHKTVASIRFNLRKYSRTQRPKLVRPSGK
jgi:DNA-binding CsgD family transcriptional regulator